MLALHAAYIEFQNVSIDIYMKKHEYSSKKEALKKYNTGKRIFNFFRLFNLNIAVNNFYWNYF
jgi:hypothetical protein